MGKSGTHSNDLKEAKLTSLGCPTWSWTSLIADIYQDNHGPQLTYGQYVNGLAVDFPQNDARTQFWLSIKGLGHATCPRHEYGRCQGHSRRFARVVSRGRIHHTSIQISSTAPQVVSAMSPLDLPSARYLRGRPETARTFIRGGSPSRGSSLRTYPMETTSRDQVSNGCY